MHANLIVSQSNLVDKIVENLAKQLGAKTVLFPIQKIEDTRNLKDFVKLSFSTPTLIVCKDIHKATTEALNAFLKNLEEPSENIYYALTTDTVKKVLPTIVSRCQIIQRPQSIEFVLDKKTESFINNDLGGKFLAIEKLRDRSEAITFVENIVGFYHNQIHQLSNAQRDYQMLGTNADISLKTLNSIKAGGNINLQLINLVINLG